MGLFLPRPTQSPVVGSRIHASHSLAAGLVAHVIPGLGDVCSSSESVLYLGASIDWRDGRPAFISTSTSTDAVAVQLPASHPLYSITTQFSVAFWINPFTAAGYANWFSIPYRTSATWSLPYNSLAVYRNTADGDKVYIQWANPGGAVEYAAFPADYVSMNVMQCLVVTRNGATCEIYRNGAFAATTTANGNSDVHWNDKRPIVFLNADTLSLPNAGYSGYNLGASVWNRVLSVAEVATLYAEPHAFLTR